MNTPLKTTACTFLLALFLLSGIKGAYTQTYSRKYGVITPAEIELVKYAPDTIAEAVVLFDIGSSKFVQNSEGGYDLLFERTTRIKILSDAGIDYATVEIPLYQEGNIYEKVEKLEAHTYNFIDGKLTTTELNQQDVFQEKKSNSWLNKKFTMPNVQAGSVIEFRYSILSQYFFNLQDWNFQWEIPVVYSEYRVSIIPFYSYVWLLQGTNKLDHFSKEDAKGLSRQFAGVTFNDINYEFGMENVPAFRDEKFISCYDDYIMKLDFQLAKIHYPSGTTKEIMTTWPVMIKDLQKSDDFGKYIAKCGKMLPKIPELAGFETRSNQQNFDTIISCLKKSYSWDNTFSKFANKLPKEVMNDKYGHTADLNLFAVGLLREAGIEAYPIISSTRKNGKIKVDYPYLHFFNYVLILTVIDDKFILSDVTENLTPNDSLPLRCLNDVGLIVKEGEPQWVNLQKLSPSLEAFAMKIDLSDTAISAFVQLKASDYNGYIYRRDIGDDTAKFVAKMGNTSMSIIDSTLAFQNAEKSVKPYVASFQIKGDPMVINNKIYLSPFCGYTIDENPLKQPTRTYNVDMVFPEVKTYMSQINIPEGYKLDYKPMDQKISNDQFDMDYRSYINDSVLSVSFSYTFKKAVYSPDEYKTIKFYYDELVRKANDKIVLVND